MFVFLANRRLKIGYRAQSVISVIHDWLICGRLPVDALMGVGGAIFETLRRFENSVDSDDSAAAAATATAADAVVCDVIVLLLLFVIRLIFDVVVLDKMEPTVELPLAGIRSLMLGEGTIFEPCTRFTCRIIPSGAIMWLH